MIDGGRELLFTPDTEHRYRLPGLNALSSQPTMCFFIAALYRIRKASTIRHVQIPYSAGPLYLVLETTLYLLVVKVKNLNLV